jgi:hypothetical protein
MQSSPVLKEHALIRTSSQHSGSQPSLFGPWLWMVTLRTVTFLQSTGFNSHMGELIIVKSSSKTLLHRYGCKKIRPQGMAFSKDSLLHGKIFIAHLHQPFPVVFRTARTRSGGLLLP